MMPEDTLTITDDRTGKTYKVPIAYGTYPEYGAYIPCQDLRKIKASETDFGLLAYDPGFGNTGSCKSSITFIDGEKGILRYRGYPIDELAKKSTFLETAYLILNGEQPDADELRVWTDNIKHHTWINESIKKVMDAFHHDAHPMGILVGTLGVLSTFYPGAKNIYSNRSRQLQILRLIAKMPTIAAFAFRHSRGFPYAYPDNELSYAGNFLNMLFKTTEQKYEPNPKLEHALDVLFILHADHEQNCSTSSMRCIGSSQPDPFVAVAGAAAALYGPLHGGANEAVLRMLRSRIGSADKVPEFVEGVKSGEEGRLMGFGHRVYKNYDPRATIIKTLAHEVFEVTGVNPVAGDRHRARAGCSRGRVFRLPQPLSERRFLLRHHLPGHGIPHQDVPGAVRHRALGRLVGTMAGDDPRRRPAHFATTTGLHRPRRARV